MELLDYVIIKLVADAFLILYGFAVIVLVGFDIKNLVNNDKKKHLRNIKHRQVFTAICIVASIVELNIVCASLWTLSFLVGIIDLRETRKDVNRSIRDVEKIIASAYPVKPEFICDNGCVWIKDTKDRDDIYSIRIGRHHAEILHMFGDQVDKTQSGFYTSFGRFVDRKEAAKIAVAAGQCIDNKLIMGDELDSSDIF